MQTGGVAEIFHRRASLKKTTLCFLARLSTDDLEAVTGETRSAKACGWVFFSFIYLFFLGIWKLALPSYEIRCSDAGSFISKLALRFPLGTAGELLALISPSRLCDAQRRHGNSFSFFVRKAKEQTSRTARIWGHSPFFVKLSLIISSTKMMCPSFLICEHEWLRPGDSPQFISLFYYSLKFPARPPGGS